MFMKTLLEKNTLYVVATPIGNLKDITHRALEVLSAVDRIAAEDTRQSGKLLKHYGIATPCTALHEHNERIIASDIIDKIKAGETWALISDAGTPLISDPGYYLISLAVEQEIRVVPIPGVSAVLAALSAAGLPTDRFAFEGFIPAKQGPRIKMLQRLANESRTLVFFESPHRIVASVRDMEEVLGPERVLVLARELTKTFETIRKDTLSGLRQWIEADPNQQKGEMVLLLPAKKTKGQEPEEHLEAQRILQILLNQLPVKQAVSLATEITGLKKNTLYDMALKIKG